MARGLSVKAADEVAWSEIEAVFGTRGAASRCWCQRYKLAPGEAFASFPARERAQRLRQQSGCDAPGRTSGLLARLGDEPVGWCAVEPRPAYTGLVRSARVPWLGREEDREDQSVWALTCLLVRAGRRRRGISRALVAAAVQHARDGGARALEAYPAAGVATLAEERHVGTLRTYLDAGFVEVLRPTLRRAVVRIDLSSPGGG